MTRKYELVYVVSPDATDDQVTDLHTQVEAIVQRIGGQIEKTENWGRRKLAYEIGRHKEGTYVLEVINGTGELMKEIDRRLKVTDLVIRHLVVRVDEEQAVIERTQGQRSRDVAAPPRGARPAGRIGSRAKASAATPTTTATIASTWAGRTCDERQEEFRRRRAAAAAAGRHAARPARAGQGRQQRRPMFRRRKVCKFCSDKIDDINYKDTKLLMPFVPERAKILPRRISGTCALHQRKLRTAIMRARQLALIPYTAE